jgi:integrase
MTRIKAEFGTAAFLLELEEINRRHAKATPAVGTLAALMESYRRSPGFTQLAARSRDDYQKVMDYLAPLGKAAVITIDRAWIVRVRDKAFQHRGRRFGNYVSSVLSILMGHAVDTGGAKENPALRLKRIRKAAGEDEGARPWTTGEVETVLACLPPHLAAPFAIMAFTGLRIGDVIKMPRSAYDGQTIRYRTSKRRTLASIPALPALRSAIEAAPAGDATTLCVSSRGRPWTYNGLMSSWRKVRLELEADRRIGLGLSPHGLRHTVAVILREAGFDAQRIADMLAQDDPKVALDYAREAVLSDLNAEAANVVALRLANKSGSQNGKP